jgi:hypothetical protein
MSYGVGHGLCRTGPGHRPLDATAVDERIAARGLTQLGYYNGATHRAALAHPNSLRRLLG